MIALPHLCAPVSVPYRHTVRAIAPVAAVTLDLNAPTNPYARASSQDKARYEQAARGRYSADSAAPGFAAQVLVEAGLTGSDPFAGVRGARAYDSRRAPIGTLRLVA
jgi:hypothetical protein